ncbi:MAG: sulfite exporter TauE/SafE family protein [Ideonella sp. MAG2]|nr:MAG: sulfite exporter TauE/SafE family protein [Ideonella sp. MAG2]
MTFTLIFSALLMGLAGSLHCLVMCGPASAAAVHACGGAGRHSAWGGFHLGRLAGYAAAGAVAAGSMAMLAQLSQWSPALRPLWTLAHMAGLGLGLWLLWRGEQPTWFDRLGRAVPRTAAQGAWQTIKGPAKAGGVGLLWFAWPCGLLQSALLIAALANSPWSGGAVMAAFALGSSPALGLGPHLWRRWAAASPEGLAQKDRGAGLQRGLTRFAGALLAASSAWALGHGLWLRIWAYCVS